MKKKKLYSALALLLSASMLFGCTGKKNTDNTVDMNTPSHGTNTVGYEDKLFDQSYVHVIDVQISEADWADLKANPTQKTKYQVTLNIDGEIIENVSFATKGNTSLSSIASDPDSDRYSFKVNFGKYDKEQTYHGLNKLNLNNIYADATYLKDYLSYELFRQVGCDAPLTSFVQLKINGEVFGLYLAIEEVGESFLERNDSADSELYKPETSMLGNMDKVNQPDTDKDGALPSGMPDFGGNDAMSSGTPDFGGNGAMPSGTPDFGGNGAMPSGTPDFGGNGAMPDFGGGNGTVPDFGGNGAMPSGTPDFGGNGAMPSGMPDFGGNGGFPGMSFGGSNGADLSYSGDNADNYSDIFDNAVTKIDDSDKQEVVAALKALSEGKTSDALDVAAVIKYFTAHNFVMNYDSYTGSMLHNYYLMETDGKLSIVPWDYNLAFGGFSGGDASSLVNCGIDSPLSGSTEDSRPLWKAIASNSEYLELYHQCFAKLVDYINGGEFEAEFKRVYEMIRPYVESDTSAFYSVSEFDTAYENLIKFCKLRAESISLQLNGKLSTVTSNQNSADKVDTGSLNIQALGSMGNNKGDGNTFPGGNGNFPGGDFPGGNGSFPSGDSGFPGGNGSFPSGDSNFPGGSFPGRGN